MTIARIKNNGDLQIKDEIIEYPSELEGGRNLVLNSDFSEKSKHWILQYERNAVFSNKTVVLSSNSQEKKEVDSIYQNLKMEMNIEVVATVKVKGRGILRLRFGQGDSFAQNFVIDSSDKFIEIDASFPHTGNQNFMLILYGPGELTITNIKLEKGNIATDWTPAPEDLGMDYPDDIQHFATGFRADGKVMVRELIGGEDFRFTTDKKMYLNELEEGVDL